MNSQPTIEMTENAVKRVSAMIQEEKQDLFLRVFVQGGGCSGFNYGFTFEEEKNQDDFVMEYEDVSLLCDAMSMQYLAGATIDFKKEQFNEQFVINNPNATGTCGCGSSFAA